MGILVERNRNLIGCAGQIVVVAAVFVVLAFALARLGDIFKPAEKASAEVISQAEPTAIEPTKEPTATPQPSPMWAVTADILRITVVSAAATDEYNARAAKLTQERSDIVAMATAQAPATAEAAQAALEAAQIANENEREATAQNRKIDAQKRYLYEFIIPVFCVAVVLGTFFGFTARFGKVFISFIENAEPEPQAEPVRNPIIEVHTNEGRTVRRYGEAPCDDDGLIRVARGVVIGHGLADVRWIGNGFTRGEWYALRQWLIDSELAKWRHEDAHNQGAELTSSGWAFFRKIADENPSPTNDDAEKDGI